MSAGLPPSVDPAELLRGIEALGSRERELLQALLREQGVELGSVLGGRVAPREAPASFAQQRLWFLDQLQPGTPVYTITTAARLEGPLDAGRLERCLNAVVARHEALRTSFRAGPDGPLQVIAPALAVRVARLDLTRLPEAERQPLSEELLAAEARRPFDLTRLPLLRVSLVALGVRQHLLHLAVHHIVADGWSLGILMNEVATLYAATDAAAALPPVASYADCAARERVRLAGPGLEQQLEYWEERLRGPLPVLELPVQRARPAARSHQGARHSFELGPELFEPLATLARSEGATRFMAALTGFAALLQRVTGESDLLIGTPTANRPSAELEDVIGLFANTLALRLDASGRPSFRELLGRVRATALEAYAHQDAPFEQVVERLRIPRDLGRTPVFQVLCVHQAAVRGAVASDELTLEPLDVPTGTAKFDLTLFLVDSGKGLRATFEYSSELFEASGIARLAEHLRCLLAAAAAAPDAALDTLPLLDDEALALAARASAGPEPHRREGLLLHELASAQALRTPEAVALWCGGSEWTYAELNARANALAHCLRAQGVGPEVVVGLLAERSSELLVGCLAVLKAGGAYLPLEAELPSERMAILLADGGCRLLLAQRALRERTAGFGGRILWLDEAVERAGDAPQVAVASDNLAYVIYTSGSTGRPKGVAVSHRAVCNHLLWRQEAYPLGPEDRFLHKASIGFDISVWELFAPLAAGARLVFAAPGGQRDAAYLADLIARQGVTVAHFHPLMLRAVAQQPELAQARALRLAFCGGEPLPLETARLWQAKSGARLVHQYGPTETTIDASAWDCAADAEGPIPIGHPIAHTRLSVLDRHLQPLPPDVVGEICVGGLGLARGYLGRPDLTAAAFVPDPEGDGARLYRTGDLGRRRAAGHVEYVGRRDGQLKLRGVRVELGEVEAALGALPGVGAAAAVVREDAAGLPMLVGYVQLASAPSLDERGLRAELSRRLPEALVPARLVAVGELPTTSNGKIDRRRLPPLPEAAAPTGSALPRGGVEQALTEIFAGLLGRRDVGREDGFFDLGGHSLLAMQAMARVHERLGVRLPLRTLFEHPSVQALGAQVERVLRVGTPAEAPLVPGPRGELSYAQQRLWLLEQLVPGTGTYTVPVALALDGALDEDALRHAFEQTGRRHDVLRTRYVSEDGQLRAVVDHDGGIALRSVDVSGLGDAATVEAERLVRAVVEEGFDLERGPVARALLVRVAAERHLLALAVHHVAIDGWSIGVLVRELSASYAARVRGATPALPALPVQYGDWARWQRAQLEAGELDRQLEYWRARLAGARASELPGDRPRPPRPSGRGAQVKRRLAAGLRERLERSAAGERASAFMLLLAGLGLVLARASGDERIVVGTAIANRGRTEVEHLLGLFVNMAALRFEARGAAPLRALVAEAREAALGAYAHADVPFERVVEALNAPRDLSRTPLFQIGFVFQQADGLRVETGDMAISGLELEVSRARYDITIVVEETDEGYAAAADYSSDLYDEARMERLLAHYERALEALSGDLAVHADGVTLLAGDERGALLRAARGPERPFESQRCAHELFERQAALRPAAVALDAGDEQLTYGELDLAANRLAHKLWDLGAGPERIVGLLLPAGPAQVVAALATLKAGAAYLPLDPAYPVARLRAAASQARIALLVTTADAGPALDGLEVPVVRLDRDAAELAAPPAARPAVSVDSANLAYVISTSGSTGAPKNVALSHRGLVNLCAAQSEAFAIGAGTRVLAFASFGFDASVSEIFVTLLAGGTLVLRPRAELLPGRGLLQLLREREVQAVTLPPSVLAHLEPEDLSALRSLVVAGEALPEAVLARWGAVRGLINAYGPTEATVCATVRRGLRAGEAVTIGSPIANVQTYVLDRAFGLADPGAPGELAIGGEGVARGYLGQAALTAERFRPDPFSGLPGARLYLSGDVARVGADGELRCLGRRDRQVKLRGFRIEPGEVEAALGQTPGVAEAVVQVSGEGDEARLVAYVVPRPGVTLDGPSLRAGLRGRLPEHMLPGAVVSLRALPRTPAGKLDRRALPAAEAQAQSAAPLVPVESDLERRVAAIWCDVLKLERVSAEQAFFDLGGHSLLLVRVHARLEVELGRSLPLMLLFAHPTVRSLAAALSGGAEQQSLEASHERAGRRREAAGTRRLARQAARTRLVAHGEER